MNASDPGGYDDARLAELYDHVPGYVSRADVEFYVSQAADAGGPVLELGCGTGRVLLPTARAGLEVTGLDLSEAMLARLRAKLEMEPESVRRRVKLVHADMCGFALDEQFAVATSPFRPFQHLIAPHEQLACLRTINRHLRVGGRLVFDVFHPNFRALFDEAYLVEREDFAGVALPDGSTVRRTHRAVAFHKAEQYKDVEMVYTITHPDGRTERLAHAFPFRWMFHYEVEHLLARSGFRVAALLGSFDGSPFTDESPEMIFVAEKAADLS